MPLRSATLLDKTDSDIAAEVDEFERAMLVEWKKTLAGRMGRQPSESWKALHRRAHKGQAELLAREIHLLVPPARCARSSLAPPPRRCTVAAAVPENGRLHWVGLPWRAVG